MIAIEEITKQIQQIPPLPDVVLKVMKMSEEPETTVQDMVEVIKYDQGITMRVLRLCNSAYFGLPREISTLHEALVFLGNTTLVNFILTSYSSDFFQGANRGYGLEAGEMWRHAVATAIASEVICGRIPTVEPGLLFTAGLLHDVGKIILSDHVHQEIERIWEVIEQDECSFIEAEKRVLGYSHAEVGAKVATHWNMPPLLVNCILHHHWPSDATEYQDEVAIVHLANILCLEIGYGLGNDGLRSTLDHTSLERFGFDVQDIMSLVADVQTTFENAIDLINISK